jgi:hypothetical protein
MNEETPQPLTRADFHEALAAFRNEIREDFRKAMADSRAERDEALAAFRDEIREEVRGAVQQVTAQLFERIHDTETRLLTAFHGWARPAEIRLRSATSWVGGFEERLALLEERIARLETGMR